MVSQYWGSNMQFNSFTYWNPIKISGSLDDTTEIPELIMECDKHMDEFIAVWKNWLNG